MYDPVVNRYPIYVLSKGRYENCLTARKFLDDKADFFLVCEPHEADEYKSRYEKDGCTVLVLPPESSGRGAIPVRNWIWEDSIKRGYARHWEFDDNIRCFIKAHKGKRLPCDGVVACAAIEDLTDKYKNVAISGMNYSSFLHPGEKKSYRLNCHVYSAMLIKNDMPIRWRGEWNADTDLCLQALSRGDCLIQCNAFVIEKMATMVSKGGNTDRYQGDGRLKMARSLERMWPGVVTTQRRFNRPQHVVNWGKFKNKLILDEDFVPPKRPPAYGLKLVAKRDVKSKKLQRFISEQ